MKLVGIAFVLGICLLFAQQVLGSCGPVYVNESYQTAVAVFSGKAVSVKDYPTYDERLNYTHYEQVAKFKVDRVWKGDVEEQATFRIWYTPDLNLFFKFYEGEEYLLFADSYSPNSSEYGILGACGSTTPIVYAENDLVYLDSVTSSHEPLSYTGSPDLRRIVLIVTATVIILAIAGTLLFVFTRKPKRRRKS